MGKKFNLILVVAIVLIVVGGYMIVKRNIEFFNFMDEKYSDKKEKGRLDKTSQNVTEDDIKIIINMNGIDVPATIYYSETGLELMRMLPLEVTMEDKNNNEKNYYTSEAFITNSSVISKIKKGDIMIYSNNCIVLFYKDHRNFTYSYTKVGKVDNITLLDKAIKKGENQKVTIRLV